jgi:flagellar biogenesis protein FliO
MSRSGRSETAPADRKPGRVGGLTSLMTIGGSLALVLGLFLVVAWIMRRAVPQASVPLPAEVVEVLGRAPLAGRQHVHLIRCGKKLLLVCVTPDGAETLTEITESEEVDRLAGICRQAHPASATGAFRQVFGQFAAQPTRPGFVDEAGEKTLDPVSRRGSLLPGVKLERSDV